MYGVLYYGAEKKTGWNIAVVVMAVIFMGLLISFVVKSFRDKSKKDAKEDAKKEKDDPYYKYR